MKSRVNIRCWHGHGHIKGHIATGSEGWPSLPQGTKCECWHCVQRNVYCIFLSLEMYGFKIVPLQRLLLLSLGRPVSLIQLYTITSTPFIYLNVITLLPHVTVYKEHAELSRCFGSAMISVHQTPAFLCPCVCLFFILSPPSVSPSPYSHTGHSSHACIHV